MSEGMEVVQVLWKLVCKFPKTLQIELLRPERWLSGQGHTMHRGWGWKPVALRNIDP